MPKAHDPIVLSGRLFVDKLLAFEHRDLALAERTPHAGDIKLLAVPKQEKPHCKGNTYSGFLAAYIFDGKGWRKFALRGEAATPSTYKSQAERSRVVHDCYDMMRRLKGRRTVFDEKAYEVEKAHEPVVPTPPPAQVKPVPTHAAKTTRRRRKGEADPNQLNLFK